MTDALVVKRTSWQPPKLQVQVRFLAGVLDWWIAGVPGHRRVFEAGRAGFDSLTRCSTTRPRARPVLRNFRRWAFEARWRGFDSFTGYRNGGGEYLSGEREIMQAREACVPGSNPGSGTGLVNRQCRWLVVRPAEFERQNAAPVMRFVWVQVPPLALVGFLAWFFGVEDDSPA